MISIAKTVLSVVIGLFLAASSSCLVAQETLPAPIPDPTPAEPASSLATIRSDKITGVELPSLQENEPVPQSFPEVQGPGEEVWQLILEEYQSAQEVSMLELRIRNLLEMERERVQRMMESQAADSTAGQSTSATGQSPLDQQLQNQASPSGTQTENPVEPQDVAASEDNTSLNSKRILSEPPDRLALADSLFVSGNNELALELYQGLSKSDADWWIRYQMANCLRRLGRWDEAKKLLREIADAGVDEPWVENAKWLIDIGNRKQSFSTELTTFDRFIKSKEK